MTKARLYEQMMKEGVVRRGDDPRLTPTRLPIGIGPIDEILGGGIPRGAVTLIVGPESTGKTIICQYAIAAQQKTERPHVLYLDAERTYDPDWWVMSGVDINKVFIARPATGEQMIDLVVDAIDADDQLGMIVVDSLAALPPSKIVAETAERTDIGSLARLVNLLFIKVLHKLDDRVLIATNQLRENIGGYGEKYPGGRSQSFYAHIILRTRREGWIEENGSRIGFNLEVGTAKNKTTAPQQSAQVPFLFRSQMDLLSVAIEEAVERGTIRKSLPYYYIDSVEEKFLGKARLRQYLAENPDVVKEL